MLFFGERERREDPRAAWSALAEALRAVEALAPGAPRHAAVASLLVRAGEIAQGVADAEAEAAGADRDGPAGRAALHALGAMGRALWASFRSGGAAPPPAPGALGAALAAPLPEVVRTRRAEGFALYAVYPETYAAAAEALRGSDPSVIGIRSIGAPLAAMAAAGAGAARPLFTVRPRGHPFRREVALAPDLAGALAAGAGGPYAIVDEGPGLSGSSLAATAAALRRLGLRSDQLHLFTSHAGAPGPHAAEDVRALFARAPRHHVPFEALFLGDGPLALVRLAEGAIGPADGPPEDLSSGAWRAALFPDPRRWPPSQGWRERRKYLLRAGGRSWLARFAGLGETGERALARARALAAAGTTIAPVALCHGFLVEPFLEGAVPLSLAAVPRPRMLEAARRHLVAVAASFPAAGGEGASPPALLEMARANAAEALGADAGPAVDRLAALLPEVEATARPVAVDGRLARWEWLVLRDGRIVKTDALEHHVDHALVGCQDALWDVAGAELELGLTEGEALALAGAVRAAGKGAPPRSLPFFRAAYAAFELGRWTLAASDPGIDGDERDRRRQEAGRYREALRHALFGHAGVSAAPPDRGLFGH